MLLYNPRWVHVKIGDSTVLRNVKLCTRCNYTTIDPATGRNITAVLQSDTLI